MVTLTLPRPSFQSQSLDLPLLPRRGAALFQLPRLPTGDRTMNTAVP